MNRRQFLFHSGGGLGGVALAEMFAAEQGGLHHAPKVSEWCSCSCRALPASATFMTTSHS